MAGSGEFDFIRQRLKPLTENDPAALELTDDGALLAPVAGQEQVLACDTLVAGVHFLATDAPETVASRALRTNLSDMAAMGAEPQAYLSAISWPAGIDAAWRSTFVDALHEEQTRFRLNLIGGDTTSTPGPLTITLTLIGRVPTGSALLRSGARPGDEVWVSGIIGDAGLGLRAERDGVDCFAACRTAYMRPEPRLALGLALRDVASAALDVSDGLIADAAHLAASSNCQLALDVEAVPISPTAQANLAMAGGREALLTSGDDYELLFTAGTAQRDRLAALGDQLGVALTRIGEVRDGQGVVASRADGRSFEVSRAGFTHF